MLLPLQHMLLIEVVQLVMLQQLQIALLLHKGMHRLSVVNKIQPYVIRRSNNVCKPARSKGNSRLVHKGSNKLAHNSKGSKLVLWAVAVAQQEAEVVQQVVAVMQVAVAAVIVDNR